MLDKDKLRRIWIVFLSTISKYFIFYYAHMCCERYIKMRGTNDRGMYRITITKRNLEILKYSICIYGTYGDEEPVLLYKDGQHFACGWQFNFICSCRTLNTQKSVGELAEERNNIYRLRLSAEAFTQRL